MVSSSLSLSPCKLGRIGSKILLLRIGSLVFGVPLEKPTLNFYILWMLLIMGGQPDKMSFWSMWDPARSPLCKWTESSFPWKRGSQTYRKWAVGWIGFGFLITYQGCNRRYMPPPPTHEFGLPVHFNLSLENLVWRISHFTLSKFVTMLCGECLGILRGILHGILLVPHDIVIMWIWIMICAWFRSGVILK